MNRIPFLLKDTLKILNKTNLTIVNPKSISAFVKKTINAPNLKRLGLILV